LGNVLYRQQHPVSAKDRSSRVDDIVAVFLIFGDRIYCCCWGPVPAGQITCASAEKKLLFTRNILYVSLNAYYCAAISMKNCRPFG
jgi:hypothetical protein